MRQVRRATVPGMITCIECKKKNPKYHKLFVTAPPGFGTVKECPGVHNRWEQIVYNNEEIHNIRMGMY